MLKRFAIAVLILLGGLIAISVPGAFSLGDYSSRKDRLILAEFERVAASAGRGGSNIPPSTTNQPYTRVYRYEVRLAPIDNALCDDRGFEQARKQAGDKTLLTIWRGEWMECYSPVSRTSTVSDGTRSRLVLPLLLSAISAMFFLAAWRLAKDKKASNPTTLQPTP